MAKDNRLIVLTIMEFFNPEYLKICNWLSLNKFIKKNWVEIKKTKGNISKSNDGAFKKEIYSGKYASTSTLLKNSISVKIFKIKTKPKKINEILKNDFIKLKIINFIYTFIFLP